MRVVSNCSNSSYSEFAGSESEVIKPPLRVESISLRTSLSSTFVMV
jgi:hypothetical protein